MLTADQKRKYYKKSLKSKKIWKYAMNAPQCKQVIFHILKRDNEGQFSI